MQFLEECRKAEEEGKAGQAKAKVKVKTAAATLPPTKDDEFFKTTQISATSNRCLGGASERLGVSCKGQITLLKGGQDWGPLLWERGLWDKTFQYRGRRLLEEWPALSARSQLPVQK